MAVVFGIWNVADAAGAALGEVEGTGVACAGGGQARLQLAVPFALAAAVLGQDAGHGAGLLADLAQRAAQLGVHRMDPAGRYSLIFNR